MKFLPILILVLLLVPYVAFAQCSWLGLPSYCSDYGSPCLDLKNEAYYCAFRICCHIVTVGRWLFIAGIALALIIVIYAGISLMVAGANEEQVKKGKKILIFGLIGSGVILLSGFLLGILAELLY